MSEERTSPDSSFGARTYGEPCRECGFTWSIRFDEAVGMVRAAPADFESALSGATGRERRVELAWSVASYVCHVADNLRIWAERLAGVAAGAPSRVAPYDNDLLAKARRYDGVSLQGALWSLGRAVGDWLEAVRAAEHPAVVLDHPDRGRQPLIDVVRSNAHDVHHHLFDVARSLPPD